MFFIKIKHSRFFVFCCLFFFLGISSFARAANVVMDVDDILQDIIGVEEQRAKQQRAKPQQVPQQVVNKPKPVPKKVVPKIKEEKKAPPEVVKEKSRSDERKSEEYSIFQNIVYSKVINLSDDATTEALQESDVMPEDVRQFLGNHTRAIYLSLAIQDFDNNLEDYKKQSLENFKSVSLKGMDEYQTFFVHKMYDVPFMYLNDREKANLDLFLQAYAEDTAGIKTVIIYTRSYISKLNEDFNSVKGYLNAIYVHWLKNYILEQLGSIARVVIIRIDNIPYDRVFLKLGDVKIESHKIRNIYNTDIVTIQQWLYNNDIMEKIVIDEKNIIYKKFEDAKKMEKAQEAGEEGMIF